jgi:uncharacterized membrane protein
MHSARLALATIALLAQACRPAVDSAEKPALPGGEQDTPWAGITADETLRFTGTEPFWGGEVTGTALTWKTPENQGGTTISVQRFAGRNGLGFSGTTDAAPFELAVSEADCSDGMSDRRYPFTITVRKGEDILRGCGWTDRRPFAG